MAGAAPPCAALARQGTPTLQILSAAIEDGACVVRAMARPRPRSAIRIELRLPEAARWSGRYYQMGNGGFAGTIPSAVLAEAARRGDVAAATDTGHAGSGFDARWAKERPDLILDYAWRSIGDTPAVARRIIAAYYGRPARRRYFMGCSFGGRQALVAGARWPAEWDGLIVGAPAVRWPATLAAFATIAASLDRPGARFTAADVARWSIAARADPRWLARCRAGPLCLSKPQRHALMTIVQSGYPLVTADAGEWARWILSRNASPPSQRAFAVQARRNLFPTMRQDRLRQTFAIGSLAPFARRGGRVIAYVGDADAVTPPEVGLTELRARSAALGGALRLFVVPGMAHCQGGSAPHAFGQSLAAPSFRDDAVHDIRRALETWVEQGRVPERLIAATPKRNDRFVTLRAE
ncbi:tannase/feruloyl esterase family alpha/beta hydrolase [Sphingomonas jatrophae]|uniref:tannase/feruloyl esterase family alpha/beta hydrolase n=1 Tax=Sphingomonas jatrophae TaxID=1166337 RepID=UPI0013F4F82D|nr:tannase/feruloyl esterase family alpha/beta hydrolase [Sphingomonas jatrophae]